MIGEVLNYVYEYRVGVQPEAALPARWCSPARAPQAPPFPAAAAAAAAAVAAGSVAAAGSGCDADVGSLAPPPPSLPFLPRPRRR
jgi:hypothetical protein